MPSSKNAIQSAGEHKDLEIGPYEHEPPSTSSDGGSIRHGSPFIPHVGGARSMGATSATSAGTPTPLAQKVPKENIHKSRRKMERERERKAAPEKDLTLFAMRLAVLEKIASHIGTLGFIWATVVILGGYAITLKEIDFWFVTVILVTEGARIFSRSHELEWQHQDVGTTTSFTERARRVSSKAYKRGSDAVFRNTRRLLSALSSMVSPGGERIFNSKVLEQIDASDDVDTRKHHVLKRTWSTSRVSIVPFMSWIFRAKRVSRLLYWMQLVSAALSIALSVLRLRWRDYNRPDEGDTERNHAAALDMFYSLTVFEALVFLCERAYWQYKISWKKILVEVNRMCGLQQESLYTVRRFFYDVYSKCLTESIFEGLKMDLVDYSIAWLQSDIAKEQLSGVRALLVFTSHKEFSEDTLRRIGTRQGVVERLIEMITWENPEEQEVRKAAADLLTKLVKYNRNSIRVAAISGAIEGIFSLLLPDAEGEENDPYSREYIRQGGSEPIPHKHLAIHLVGLRILKNLAKDPLNCTKIGTTRGLLARLISFIDVDHLMLRNAEEPEDRVTLVKKSLELLLLLAGATGVSGKTLREEISKVVFTVMNLRNILEYGEAHMMLQELATGILSALALDDEIRGMLGQTGGIIRNLFRLYLKEKVDGDVKQLKLSTKAGEALTLLALQNEKNCHKMLRLRLQGSEGGQDVVQSLIAVLGDWELGHLAIRILRSFCEYTNHPDKARIAACTPQVMKIVMDQRGKAQEAAIGLAAHTVSIMSMEDYENIFNDNFTKASLVKKLGKVLERHPIPSTTLPRIRRFSLELVMALVDKDASLLAEFQSQNFRYHLEKLLDTSSNLENYSTFSGATGVTMNTITMEDLIDQAISKLHLDKEIFP